MKRKRTRSSQRHNYHRSTGGGGFTSTSSSSSCSDKNSFSNRRYKKRARPAFVSKKFIKKQLSQAIEQEKCEKVLEILKKYQTSQCKKQKINVHIIDTATPMDVDPPTMTSSSFSRPITSHLRDTVTRKITWSSFLLDPASIDNPLHYACRLGKTCLIDSLLETGYFDINEPNYSADLDSCLTIACDEGQLDIAKILIARGADVNYETRKAKNALILATELIDPCDTELVRMLLQANALVNKTTSNGNTVLLSAAKYGNLNLIGMLLYANANLNWEYNDGASPLMRACYYNHPRLVEYFLERGALIESTNVRMETPLYIASFRGYLEIVKILIESGANINCEDIDGDTPLSVACYEEKTHVITYLLAHGSIVNKHGIRGDTPLHIAVSNCSKRSVEELIQMGANCDALNRQNETPLHIITRQNRIEILKVILSHAKNLDVCSNYSKRTPFKNLMDEIQIDKLKMAIMFVRAGCDVNLDYQSISNVNESPFKFLFKISKNNFKFITFLRGGIDGMGSFASNLPIDENSHFRFYINLIDLIFRAGYRSKLNDCILYRDSWVFSYLSGFIQSPSSHEFKAKQILDHYFIFNFNKPFTLQNLCKFTIRSMIQKPINKSIDRLDIPQHLKIFCNLDSSEV